jgi:hypothetical protein
MGSPPGSNASAALGEAPLTRHFPSNAMARALKPNVTQSFPVYVRSELAPLLADTEMLAPTAFWIDGTEVDPVCRTTGTDFLIGNATLPIS